MSSAAQARAGPGTQLALATLAFTVCFYAWSLLGPLSPDFQDALDLSDFQTSAMVAVPVLLGSLMRIPLGWLTDRDGGRRVFTALMAFTPVPLVALALWHDSLGTVLVFGLLLGFAGASFAVGVPFVNGWYAPERRGAALGLYGVGMGGSVLAGLTAPRIADRWGLSAPFWVATVLIVAMCAVFKLVPEWFPDRVGAVTGVVGAAGGLGGFFPPLIMGIVKSATGGYALGFVLMALVAFACLIVLRTLRVPRRAEPALAAR